MWDQILIIIVDFADDPTVTRQSKMLHTLYSRVLHNMTRTIIANAICPIIRVNATEFFVYRLRNMKVRLS